MTRAEWFADKDRQRSQGCFGLLHFWCCEPRFTCSAGIALLGWRDYDLAAELEEADTGWRPKDRQALAT
jgi:hypothetical protein